MMKHPSKSRVHLAVAAAVGSATLALAPAASQAQPPMGGSATNTGQIATAYFIAQPENGWQTLFNVTNTTNTALAVKMRVKEFKNSRDSIDFWILLSPYDVWTGWLQRDDPAGTVALYSNDNSCTSPLLPEVAGTNLKRIALKTQAFYGLPPDNADDGGSATEAEALNRNSQGHVEFVVGGQCDADSDADGDVRCFKSGAQVGFGEPDGIGYLTKHVNGVPRDCATADTYFNERVVWNGVDVPGNGNPKAADASYNYQSVTELAPIKVNVAYLQVGDGTGAATQALHLDDVVGEYVDAPISLISAQDYPYNMEPTMATAPAGLWDARGLLDLEQRFTWTNTLQEWSVNAVNGVQTSIMFNFPTKGYHVDQYCAEMFASNNRWRYDGTTALDCANAFDQANYGLSQYADYSPTLATGDFDGVRLPAFQPTLAPFPNRWALSPDCIENPLLNCSPIRIGFRAYDREELWIDETAFSPNRQITILPWEVALMSFDVNGGAFGPNTGEIYVPLPSQLGPNGWINVAFTSAMPTDVYTPPGTDAHGNSFMGLPMHGIMVKTRDLGVPGTAYGQGTENGYQYEAVETGTGG